MNATETQELRQLTEERPLLTTALMERVRNYFQNPEHRAAFDTWYEKKYGKKYAWKQ